MRVRNSSGLSLWELGLQIHVDFPSWGQYRSIARKLPPVNLHLLQAPVGNFTTPPPIQLSCNVTDKTVEYVSNMWAPTPTGEETKKLLSPCPLFL